MSNERETEDRHDTNMRICRLTYLFDVTDTEDAYWLRFFQSFKKGSRTRLLETLAERYCSLSGIPMQDDPENLYHLVDAFLRSAQYGEYSVYPQIVSGKQIELQNTTRAVRSREYRKTAKSDKKGTTTPRLADSKSSEQLSGLVPCEDEMQGSTSTVKEKPLSDDAHDQKTPTPIPATEDTPVMSGAPAKNKETVSPDFADVISRINDRFGGSLDTKALPFWLNTDGSAKTLSDEEMGELQEKNPEEFALWLNISMETNDRL